LMSLSATQAYYSSEDCAVRIIPAVSPLAIDVDKEVRENAFKTLELFVNKLKTFSEKGGEEETEIEEKAKAESNVLGWAFSSLTKKIYGDVNPNQTIGPGAEHYKSDSSPSTPSVDRKREELEEYHAQLFQKSQASEEEENDWNDFDTKEQPQVYKPRANLPVKATNSPLSSKSPMNLSKPIAKKPSDDDEEKESQSDDEPNGWGGDDGWNNDDDDDWGDFEVTKPKESKIDKAKEKKSGKK